MTIIVYRSGVMAADTAVWRDDLFVGHTVKIARRSDGYLIGTAGAMAPAETIRKNWLKAKNAFDIENPEEETSVIMVCPQGLIYELCEEDWAQTEDQYAAEGAGMDVALGALSAGATAEEAVAHTIMRHAKCGGEITSYTHKSATMKRRTVLEVLGRDWV